MKRTEKSKSKRTAKKRTVKTETKKRTAKRTTAKKTETKYMPELPAYPFQQDFDKGTIPFQNFKCFGNVGVIPVCKSCKIAGFCKDKKKGKNIFGFPQMFAVKKTTKKRQIVRTKDKVFIYAVSECIKNPNMKAIQLVKRVNNRARNKSASSIASMISSIRCCLNAFSGKSKKDSAVYAIALVMTSATTTNKKEVIKKAVKICNKPEKTVAANYSYMKRVYNAMQDIAL